MCMTWLKSPFIFLNLLKSFIFLCFVTGILFYVCFRFWVLIVLVSLTKLNTNLDLRQNCFRFKTDIEQQYVYK